MPKLEKFLNDTIKRNPQVGWTYKEFGKQVEKPIIQFLLQQKLLHKGHYIDQSENKNEIPDIIDDFYNEQIFIDIKAGNVVQYSNGRRVTNPNQDLSTTMRWQDETLKKFKGENCFFIEVRYHHLVNEDLYVVDCKIDKFYNFVGKTPKGLISTRRRNVRTKSWNSPSQYSSASEFEKLLSKTISNSIKNDIINNMKYLDDDDRNKIIKKLSDKK